MSTCRSSEAGSNRGQSRTGVLACALKPSVEPDAQVAAPIAPAGRCTGEDACATLPGALRICLVAPAYPYRGGIAHYTACLAETFARRGHTVEIINYASLYPRLLFPGKTMMDTSAAPLQVPSTRVLKPLAPWTWLAAARRIRRFQPDVVLFQWWHVFFSPGLLSVLGLVRGKTRPATVVLCHNTSDHEKHEFLNRIANGLLLRMARAVVVHSAREAASLNAGRSRARIVRMGHPPYEFFSGLERLDQAEARRRLKLPSGPLVLFFGLVRGYKGLADLLNALPLLRDRSIRLLIAGEFYEPQEHYMELIRRLGLEDRVTVDPRYVPNEELPAYFCAADVLVTPYRSASQSGIVAIARAFGLPAIVTDVGGLPEMIEPEETGLTVPPSSPARLAEALQRYFDENLSGKFRENLAHRSAHSSWDAMCARIEAL